MSISILIKKKIIIILFYFTLVCITEQFAMESLHCNTQTGFSLDEAKLEKVLQKYS